jgi:four helix bundle protein
MATITSFEDLEIWKNARQFSATIYELSSVGPFKTDFGLRDQINRASGSIMDNIAEGFERDGKKEFINFLSYSKGSVGECRSQLYRSLDRKHIDNATFVALNENAKGLGKQIAGLINYLKRSEYRGIKFSDKN